MGLLVAATPAVHYKRLETAKISASKKEKGNFDKWMAITQEMTVDLIWWLNHNSEGNWKILLKDTEVDLYTDASNLGLGGLLNRRQVNGRCI